MKARIIINGKDIYQLEKRTPAVIDIYENTCTVTITDGFHHSKVFYVKFDDRKHMRLKISSILDNGRLVFILLITTILFLMAFLNELFWVKIISFVPVLLALYLYYVRRKSFFLLEAF